MVRWSCSSRLFLPDPIVGEPIVPDHILYDLSLYDLSLDAFAGRGQLGGLLFRG
jgi:hypothetical protein